MSKKRICDNVFSLHFVEDTETYEIGLQRSDAPPKGKEADMFLFMVVLTVTPYSYIGMAKGLPDEERGNSTPATSIYYVLAEDEDGAAQQVSDNAVGIRPVDGGEGNRLLDEGRMTAVAHRVPFHIRGWGSRTF